MQWQTLAEYVGISDADLTEGERDERFGVEVGWQEKATRIGHALCDGCRGSVPIRGEPMFPALSRSDASGVTGANDRLAALEQQNAELAQRLDAIETRLPSFKEVKDFVAA